MWPSGSAIGEEATAEHPKKQLPLILGMIEYEGDPEVVAELVRQRTDGCCS